MKKSYIKILIFEIIILFILTLNIFIQNILNKYVILLSLIILILIFKKIFGKEKEKRRYTKDLIIDISITYLIFFLLYYSLGLITGFYKTNNYFTLYGLENFIIPTISIIILKEYFRSLICNKYDDSKILYVVTFIMFVMLDLINMVKPVLLVSVERMFFFVAVTLLPAISNNITANYIAKNSNYKVNVFWLLVLNLYVYLLPIIPNVGEYILSVIKLILPILIFYKVKMFFEKEKDHEIKRNYNKKQVLPLIIASVIILILVYFTSGFFRYYAVAIASGSMKPQIARGDVVVIDQNYKLEELKEGQVIAYKHKNVIVVHRLIKKIDKEDKYYFYTKGDANLEADNYVIKEEEIIGIVNIKIPYIGLPTVWLSEI